MIASLTTLHLRIDRTETAEKLRHVLSSGINAQKKSKEGSPDVNFDIAASIDQGKVPNEETPSEMAAILETDQPPWVRLLSNN